MMNGTQKTNRVAVIDGKGVWLEGSAVKQLADAADREACHRAVGMPDLHTGPGIPIGAVFAFKNRVAPLLIGSDAGCGVLLIVTKSKVSSLDKLERRLRGAFEEPTFILDEQQDLLDAVCAEGVHGLRDLDPIGELSQVLPQPPNGSHIPDFPSELRSGSNHGLGTIGGGNHFVEVSRVTAVPQKSLAATFGLNKGAIVVVVHSGSRSFGHAFADRWHRRTLVGKEIETYVSELTSVCNFARANRFVLAHKALTALGAARESKIVSSLDLIHNDVSQMHTEDGDKIWIHRKGAAPALDGQPTVVLGSRGHASWVMMGSGNPYGLWSVAHGAGRKMNRAQALGKMRAKYKRKSLTRTKLGGRVICDRTELLYEEHPDSYKEVGTVVRAIEQAKLAESVAAVEPLITVK